MFEFNVHAYVGNIVLWVLYRCSGKFNEFKQDSLVTKCKMSCTLIDIGPLSICRVMYMIFPSCIVSVLKMSMARGLGRGGGGTF